MRFSFADILNIDPAPASASRRRLADIVDLVEQAQAPQSTVPPALPRSLTSVPPAGGDKRQSSSFEANASTPAPAIGSDVTSLMPKLDTTLLPDQPRRPDLSFLPDQPKTGDDVTVLMKQDPFASMPDAPKAPVAEPFASMPDAKVPPPDKRSIWEKALDTVAPPALRIGGAVVGGAVGVIGGLPGVIAGGAAGSGLGETAAQSFEKSRGLRDEINPLQIATQTALGAIPVVGRTATPIRTALSRAAQGAALGGASDVATKLAEGEMPTVGGAARGAALGAAIGGPFGALEARAVKRAAPAAPPTPASRVAALPAGRSQETRAVPFPQADPKQAELAVRSRLPNFEIREVKIADLLATQPEVSVASVQPHLSGRIMAPAEVKIVEGRANAPVVVQHNGQLFLADGTHRVVASWARGEQTVPAVVFQTAAKPSAVTQPSDLLREPAATAALASAHPPPSTRQIERLADAISSPIPAQRSIPPSKQVEELMAAKFPEEQREQMLEIIRSNGGFEAQRRGVQSDARRDALAAFVEVPKGSLPKGTTFNDVETVALGSAVAGANARVQRLASQAQLNRNRGVTDLAADGELELALQEQTALLQNWLGVRAEAGRALRAHDALKQILNSNDVTALREALKHQSIRDLPDFSAQWAKLKTPQTQLEFIRSHQKLTKWQALEAVRYANILSGVKTSLRNVLGTGVNAAFNAASHVGAVGYDIAESALTKRPRTTYIGEISPKAQGAIIGMKQGLDDALFTLKNGYAPRYLRQGSLTFDLPRPELRGGGKNPFNYPGRFLEAQDQFGLAVAFKSELQGRLFAKARSAGEQQGLTGQALDDAVAKQVADWTLAPPPDIAKAAEEQALRVLFREEPGAFVKKLIDIRAEGGVAGKVLSCVAPFIKIPANLARQSVEAAPGGAFLTAHGRKALAAGGRERAEAAGRMMTGTAGLATLAYWAANGKISGNGPRDPEERAALIEAGWRPNAVKVGDHWVDYTIPFQSISVPLAVIANAWDRYRETGDVPVFEKVWRAALGTGGSILDQSFLTGVSQLNAALNDPKRAAGQFGRSAAQSYVPFSGLSRNVAQALDPVIRDAKTPIEAVTSIMPGLSESVAPRLTLFGEPAERPGDPISRGFSPVTVSKESDDRLIKELNRLNVTSLGAPPKTIPRTNRDPAITLTVAERQRLGRAVREALTRLFVNPGWTQIDDERARAYIERAVAAARAGVREEIRRERRSGTQRTTDRTPGQDEGISR